MIDLAATLKALASKRPIFHSEADFQLALGMEIERAHPDVAVRLEYKPFPGERVHLDMWIYHEGRWMAVELKYKTRHVSVDWHGERFELVQQGAQDLSGYDVWKDVTRVERICGAFENVDGYVIVLSNDSSLWRRVSDTDTSVGAAFRLFEGRRASGALCWASHAGAGTMKARETPLSLGNEYELHWQDYSRLGAGQGETLRMLVISVTWPRPVAVAPLPVLIAEAKERLRNGAPQATVPVRSAPSRGRRLKYAPLGDYLRGIAQNAVTLSYQQIEEIIGASLPPSAHNHGVFWANAGGTHVWAVEWMAAGWKVTSYSLTEKRVSFARIQ